MGYKLAGFDVLGGVEIDPRMMEIYRANLRPLEQFSFMYPVQDFKVMSDSLLPKELFDLDVLDGSPPCSSFSMAGSREDAWGKSKKFREGQANQVLDDLFFHYIDIAKKLKPKVVVAENVKGLVIGAARGYVSQIFEAFREAGYETQLFLLNASRMGVPQARERTFFVARRRDLKLPELKLEFREEPISLRTACAGIEMAGRPLTGQGSALWRNTAPGRTLAGAHKKGNMFTWTKLHMDKPANTATSGPAQMCPHVPNHLSDQAQARIQSFPDDYDFLGSGVRYVCGMSVPPLMMQRVALELAKQLFGKTIQTKIKRVIPDGDKGKTHPRKPSTVP